ncbi:hypothetical protein LDENG_00196850 [Lucifuga dentata]|nr:hypothetical protein LDENG_00196850 [Lucifuga dentata]
MLLLLLLSCSIIAGIMAEDLTVVHYGLKSGSVCLHTGNSSGHPVLLNSVLKRKEWVFENTRMVAYDERISKIYEGKVDYNPESLSLCIKNLTERDSGSYSLSIHKSDDTKSSETHRLIVQEAVPRPVIRMSVLHANLSAEVCNVMINCSIRDDWAWSECDANRCITPQKSSAELNITIATMNKMIVCRGKNHVSANEVSESVEQICFNETIPEDNKKSLIPKILTLTLGSFGFLCIFSLLVCLVLKMLTTYKNLQEETIIAESAPRQIVQAQPKNVQEEHSSSEIEANYENIENPCCIETDGRTITLREEAESNSLPDTVYCLLQLPAAVANLDQNGKGNETEGNKNKGEGAMPETVYSTVQPLPETRGSFSEAAEKSSVSSEVEGV